MAKDLNKVMLTGRLGKDPDMRVAPNGTPVTTFSVASSRNIKDGDGWKEQTEWFRVVAWDRLAETCEKFLKKGSRVYIEGRLQTREYMDKNNEKRYSTEVIANDMMMLDAKRQEGGSTEDAWDSAPAPAPARSNNRRPAANDFDDSMEPEDIPF